MMHALPMQLDRKLLGRGRAHVAGAMLLLTLWLPGGCADAPTRSSSALSPSPWNKAAAERREAPPPVPMVGPTPLERWRPEWWGDQPLRDDGLITVWAMAEDADLLTARVKAISRAEAMLAGEAGRSVRTLGTVTDSVQLESGLFRALVRVEGVPR